MCDMMLELNLPHATHDCAGCQPGLHPGNPDEVLTGYFLYGLVKCNRVHHPASLCGLLDLRKYHVHLRTFS